MEDFGDFGSEQLLDPWNWDLEIQVERVDLTNGEEDAEENWETFDACDACVWSGDCDQEGNGGCGR